MGCLHSKKKDVVFEEFKSQIESRGMKIDSVDETGFIYISQGEQNLKISLDNLRKDYERDKDTKQIVDFVQTLISYSAELPKNWVDAKNDIYIALFPNDTDFQDVLYQKVTDEFSKGYVHSAGDKLIWITQADLDGWKITTSDLYRQAINNADQLLRQTTISVEIIENRKLGLIEAEHTSLKGALLFAPAMKKKVRADFGFPFYAVIPVRDFCYIFSERDFDFFSERIGKIVVEEYKQSGYPVTTEILKFTENGVEAVGKYPTE